MKRKDRQVLRELAKEVAEIAGLPVQQEKIALWKALNGLKPVRPMVMVDEVPWNEMDVDGELALQTEDEFCREIETTLRRTLYSWNHMRTDMVVEPVVIIPKVIRSHGFAIKTQIDGLGVEILERTMASDPENEVLSHSYVDQLKTEEDLQKIRMPEVVLDDEATAKAEEKAHELFDGILSVRTQGWLPRFGLWEDVVQWRGAENVLFDLADRPEFMHQIAMRVTDARLAMLDQLEQKALLGYGQTTIHCTGAYTDELPAPGFDPCHPRARDLWTYGQAQTFASVSPSMHQEFELDYAVKWYARFGLVYYGCCDPLDDKIDIIRRIPHLRKISMSPFVDVEKGAERIGREFVFSRKPNSALLAVDTWAPDRAEQDLRDTIERCARYGCPLELILKDISTVRFQPQRLWEWAAIAMRLVG